LITGVCNAAQQTPVENTQPINRKVDGLFFMLDFFNIDGFMIQPSKLPSGIASWSKNS